MSRMDSRITLWLAGPKASTCFDPAAQSGPDQQRWRRIRSERRRLDWMVSRALLARAAPPQGHAVSLSHSSGHAAVAIAPPDVKLGVDLEFQRPRDVASLARLAFSSRELANMAQLSDGERIRHFYILWTLKEALAKAFQVDLLKALTGYEITATLGGWQTRCDSDAPWSAQVFAPGECLILAVVWAGPTQAVSSTAQVSRREWPQTMASPWKCIARIRHEPAAPSSRADNSTGTRLAQSATGRD